jgi:hypothetical protein
MSNRDLLETVYDILANNEVAQQAREEVARRIDHIDYDVHEIVFDGGKVILALADLRGE